MNLAVKIVSEMGSRKETLVVLSTTMTVIEMVMRQMPPSIAAAPMSA